MRRLLYHSLLVALLCASAVSGRSQEWKQEIPPPPDTFLNRDEYQRLSGLKNSLEVARRSVIQGVEYLEAHCSAVPDTNRDLVTTCAAKRRRVLEEIQSLTEGIRSYKTALKAELDSELPQVQRVLVDSRVKIEQLADTLEGYRAALDEWNELSAEAAAEARVAAKDTLATVLLSKLEAKKESQLELTAELHNSVNEHVRKGILDEPALAEALRNRIAARLVSLRTEKDFLNTLSITKDGLGIVPEHFPDDGRQMFERVLTSILKGIAIVARDPAIRLLIADGELVSADFYLWRAQAHATERVEQLSSLGAEQLRALNSLMTLYKKSVTRERNFRKLRAALEK